MRLPRAVRDELWARVGYRPYAEQRTAHNSEARIRLIAGGERAGKSRSAAMEVAGRFLEGQLYWLVGPDYDLCRPEFTYLVESLESLDAIETLSTPSGQSNRMTLRNGTVIATRTAQRALRLAGQAPDGILGCEAAQLSYEAFLRLSGRLAERRGWLWLSGTFEGSRGWYAEKFRAWQTDNPDQAASFSIPSWSNRTLFPGGREDPEIRRLETTYPSDLFQERFGGAPCPPVSLVFREFEPAAHVRSIQDAYESFDNIEIAVDPGYAGAYAVLAVAQRGAEVFVLDEVYMQYAMTSQVIEACKRRSWWPYVRSGVIDIAGRQHHAMPSQIEMWLAQARIRLRSHRVLLQDGIERLRTFLRDPGNGEPRMTVNSRCQALIREFGNYRYHEPQEHHPVSEQPIDADNHAIKALCYWLYDRFGAVYRREPRRSIPFRVVTD